MVYTHKTILFYFILIVVSSFFLSTCADFNNIDDSTVKSVLFDLEEIKKRGTLIALVENSSTGYYVYKGKPKGFEYELLQLFSKEIGVKLKIVSKSEIKQAFQLLKNGEVDLIAYPFTVTQKRKKQIDFSNYLYTSRQVLVQKKPNNWRVMTKDQIEKKMIRNQVNLIGKKIHVKKHSAFVDRLENLSNEIGGKIIIKEEPDSLEVEELIERVAKGEIQFTVADEITAKVKSTYFSHIDVKTPLSFPQRIAWGVRKNSPELKKHINNWLKKIKNEPTFNVIYNRYFNNPRFSKIRHKSQYSSIGGGNISPYDEQVKIIAEELGWDWRIVVSQMYHESEFDPNAKSWADAHGLMQLIPETGARFGATDLYDPEQNIRAAGNFLKYLDSLWLITIKSKKERQKFVLASYNVGLNHVIDARNLAKQFNHNPLIWNGNVEKFLLLKSKPAYYNHPLVNAGYCHCEEPVKYVENIFELYSIYQHLIE